MTRVDDRKASLHQLAAEPISLLGSVDAEPREVPVRIFRMRDVHLFKDRKKVVMLVR